MRPTADSGRAKRSDYDITNLVTGSKTLLAPPLNPEATQHLLTIPEP